MEPYQRRVVAEEEDLTKKVEALGAFIAHNPAYSEQADEVQLLMQQQYDVMLAYLNILRKRIALFKSEDTGAAHRAMFRKAYHTLHTVLSAKLANGIEVRAVISPQIADYGQQTLKDLEALQ